MEVSETGGDEPEVLESVTAISRDDDVERISKGRSIKRVAEKTGSGTETTKPGSRERGEAKPTAFSKLPTPPKRPRISILGSNKELASELKKNLRNDFKLPLLPGELQ
jgi:hypothetical protein